MISRVSKRLLGINAAVFLLVLSIFSVAVYVFVTHNLNEEEKRHLWTVTDTAINSIEPLEVLNPQQPGDAIPEVLQASSLKEAKGGFNNLTLEWFDPSGTKVAERGNLKINLPLNKLASFERQDHDHALLLTRSVSVNQRILGFLRAGVALQEQDKFERTFVTGLVSGSVLALMVSCFVVIWLVRQALDPIQLTIFRLRQFTSDASHELKGPLMAIKTNAAVALKYKLGMRQKDEEKFTAILNAADQIITTTNNLLTIAESESPPAAKYPVDIASCIAAVQANLTGLAEAKKVKIEIAVLMPSPSMSVLASKEELHSMFSNIIENAVQYSDSGSIVKVEARMDNARVKVAVTDQGIGISEADLPFVFDRFWRSDKARSHNSGGNGLGLAIAQSIAARYKGTISIASAAGSGTTVVVDIPRAR